MSKSSFDKLRIDLWVSGSTDKQGNGGYCALLKSVVNGNTITKSVGGYAADTTNTRMTLKAVVEGLLPIKQKSFIHIYTTNPHVSSGINKHMNAWEKNGWKKIGKGELQHSDLWKQIFHLINEKALGHKVHFQKDSPSSDSQLVVISQSSEYVMRAKKNLKEVSFS